MEHNWEKYFDTSSIYWEKVQKIYEENDHFPKVVISGRNLHHKFFRTFSRLEGTEIDNDKENLVSLGLGDHFLAHYYLWKCTRTGYRRYTSRPVILMYKKCFTYISDETIEKIAQDWNDINVSPNKGKSFSEEHRRKISEAKKGKPKSLEHRKKMSEAHKGQKPPSQKGKHHSEEARQKMSEARKGKHWKLIDGKRVWY